MNDWLWVRPRGSQNSYSIPLRWITRSNSLPHAPCCGEFDASCFDCTDTVATKWGGRVRSEFFQNSGIFARKFKNFGKLISTFLVGGAVSKIWYRRNSVKISYFLFLSPFSAFQNSGKIPTKKKSSKSDQKSMKRIQK